MAGKDDAGQRMTTKPMSPVPTSARSNVRPFTWVDPGTWPASLKFLPAYIVLLAIFIAIYYNRMVDTGIDTSSYESCVGSFNYGYRINAALSQAHEHSTHSWEIGYAYEATQQIYSPDRSIFGPNPFPGGKLPKLTLKLDEASLYVQPHLNSSKKTLFDEDNAAVSDPAALGVAALQFSKRWGSGDLMTAAHRQKDILLNQAPRYANDAISHRFERTQLWSDAIAMFPPFLAYFGVATNDLGIMREAVRQISLYRDILRIQSGPKAGLWKHIADGSGSAANSDEGAWSTGNAWVAYGMARTRATIASWPKSSEALRKQIEDLDSWIGELLDAVIRADDDPSGLLRNYLGDATWEGEASGTSLLAATVYRMSVVRKDRFAHDRYLDWAHQKRRVIFDRVDDDGLVRPVVDPLNPRSRKPAEISPEGESFLLLLGTAWRDCVCSSPNGICLATYLNETQSKVAGELSFESLTGHTFEELIAPFTARWNAMIKYFKAP